MPGRLTDPPVSEPPDAIAKSSPIPVATIAKVTFRLRLLAGILDATIIAMIAAIMAGVAFAFYVGLTGDDFDGPRSENVAGDWFISSLFGGFAVVLTTSEIWFATSVGKFITGIEIDFADSRKRLIVRWLVKWLPLILFTAISLVGFGYMELNISDFSMQFTERFHRQLQSLIPGLPILVTALLVNAAVLRLQPIHDWLAGTAVVRRRRKVRPTGFTPIMANEE